ncbi:flagellar hook-associated protein 3 FlgL [Rhodobacter sp. 24-YEA-8]|nr:flagellar hook-associated protein 3 FlgL [Rhodobacter sp. 24-YEA-8]
MERISSNPFLTPALLRQSSELRAGLQKATQEMTTGKFFDQGKALRGDFSALAATDHALARLVGFAAATTELTLMGETMQRALSVISEATTELAANLLRTTSGASDTLLSSILSTGMRDFNTASSALNTRLADKSVFGGDASDRLALPGSETILTALETAIAGLTDVDDISNAIDDWFNGTAGYQALYTGGQGRVGLNVAPGETASLPFTALDPAIRATLAGLSKVALLDRGLFTGDHASRSALALRAGENLFNSSEARTVLAGRIGTVEQQLSQAQSRNSAEKSALALTRNGLTEADPYEATVRLKDLESRLDAFYTITARLSQLSLTGYLR